jgi:titin
MMAKHFKYLFVACVALASIAGCALEAPDDDVAAVEQDISPPPAVVTASPTSTSRIVLNWTPVPGAVKYYIYERVGMTGAEYYATTSTGTSTVRANLQPATEYCYRLQTVDSSAIPGGFSNLVCATTLAVQAPPNAPATVTATAVSSSRINVAWSSVSNADRYFVYQSNNGPNGTYSFINTVTQPSTSLAVANLMTNTQYCFKVASSNANGTSALSAAACDTTFVFGLEGYWKFNDGTGTTTNDLSGHSRTATLVNATWSAADHAPIDNDRAAVSLTGATNSSVNVNDASVWWFTAPFSFTIWTKVQTSNITRIAGKRVAGCGAVDWEIGQDASGLYLAGATRLDFGQSVTVNRWTHIAVSYDGTTASLYIDGTQVAQGAWMAGTRSTDPMQFGNSGSCGGGPVLVDFVQAYSRPLSATEIQTMGRRPAAPTNFVATPGGCQSVTLSWDAVPGASKYFVYKGTTSGDETFLNTTLSTTFVDGGNACSSQHSYYVRAAQNGLISDNSAEQVVTTLAAIAAPANLMATAVSSSRISLTWGSVTGAVKYYVYRSQPGGGTPFVFDNTVTSGTSYVSANLLANAQYSFFVVTQGSDSVSAPSNTATATTLP